jgi:hypothetical protein
LLATIHQTEPKAVIREISQIQTVFVPVSLEVISLDNLVEAFRAHLPELYQAVEEGWQSPLTAFVQIRKILHIGEFWLEKLKATALREAEALHKDELYQLGFEIVNSSEILNYQEDAEYNRLENALKERKALLKAAYRHQKALLDEDSGEMIAPVSLKTPSSPYLKSSKPKN